MQTCVNQICGCPHDFCSVRAMCWREEMPDFYESILTAISSSTLSRVSSTSSSTADSSSASSSGYMGLEANNDKTFLLCCEIGSTIPLDRHDFGLFPYHFRNPIFKCDIGGGGVMSHWGCVHHPRKSLFMRKHK